MSSTKPALPPLPRYVLPILIALLIGLVCVTAKQTFYPSQPAAWARLHEPGLSMEEADKLLTQSGAIKTAINTAINAPTETWTYQHRTGTWSLLLKFARTSSASAYATQQVLVRCDITNFPSLTRNWEYPPTTAAPAPAAIVLPASGEPSGTK